MAHRAAPTMSNPPVPPPPRPAPMDSETRTALEKIEELLNVGKGKPLDELGREIPDPRPLAPPAGYVKQPTMVDHIRDLVRSHMLAAAAEAVDAETFDEADDFEVDDDQNDPHTPYEAVFDPPAPTLPETSPAAAGDPSKPPETTRESASASTPTAESGSKPPPSDSVSS